MTLFKTNYEEVGNNDFSALPTGEYECIINNVKEKATKNGKESMNISLIVRNDLKQVPELKERNGKYADRWVFVDEWKRDINGEYKYKMDNLMHYLAAVGIPEGTEIKDMEHLFSLLRGKPVLVYIKEEENTYNGNTEMINTVAPWNFKQTKFPQVNHVFKDKEESNDNNPFANSTKDIQDDDLPF
jgi:hypothetical protein